MIGQSLLDRGGRGDNIILSSYGGGEGVDTFFVLYAWVAAIVFIFQIVLNLRAFREEFYFYVYSVQGYIPEDWQDKVVVFVTYLGFIAGSLTVFIIKAFFWWYFLALTLRAVMDEVAKEQNET